MLKKKIKYTDYNGNEREEDFFFNISRAEAIEMQSTTAGGLDQLIDKIVKTQDTPALMNLFKELILTSYGEKSLDGKRFVKSKELSEAFSQTEAYSELLMDMISGDDTANKVAEFVNGIMPSEASLKIKKKEPEKKIEAVTE